MGFSLARYRHRNRTSSTYRWDAAFVAFSQSKLFQFDQGKSSICRTDPLRTKIPYYSSPSKGKPMVTSAVTAPTRGYPSGLDSRGGYNRTTSWGKEPDDVLTSE